MTFTHDKTIKYVKKKAYQQMLYLLVLACSYVRCFIIPLSIDSENETSICYKVSIYILQNTQKGVLFLHN